MRKEHQHGQGDYCKPVLLSTKHNDVLMPLCEKHNCISNFVCLNCNEIAVCHYCKHRNHKGHNIDKLSTVITRAKLDLEIKKQEVDEKVKAADQYYFQVEKEIENFKDQFYEQTKLLKLDLLLKFIRYMNFEESAALSIIDEKLRDLKVQYAKNGKRADFQNYNQLVMEMSDLQLFFHKESISQYINEILQETQKKSVFVERVKQPLIKFPENIFGMCRFKEVSLNDNEPMKISLNAMAGHHVSKDILIECLLEEICQDQHIFKGKVVWIIETLYGKI